MLKKIYNKILDNPELLFEALAITVLTLLLIFIIGFSATVEAKEKKRFVELQSAYCGYVVYDTQTGVEYWISCGTHNGGTLTVLVDKDGKPLIYGD